ncbi:uncharacterized protein LOC108704568 isoform X2 [Xenopus laevis]|uniref:Uncharacterized protein LOC108704568 isoform X2 n=1 Tax=Xenopus laevis TaxID=8355 RepID=A0A8J1MJH6_XENLA|nr:uncharacterized protein LOC108704568 isoform X2 [Xenopus laevis]
MASDGKNRMQLACKYCMKITDHLSGHLRKVCRKGANEAEIVALVEESRVKMRMLVRNLSVVHYKQLKAGADSDRSLHFFVNFLESNGCLVCEKPSHTDTERTSAEEVENPVQDAVEEEEDTYEEEMDTEHPFLMLRIKRVHILFPAAKRPAFREATVPLAALHG